MDEHPRNDVSDKYSWQYSNCKCRLSIKNKSRFLSKYKLPLQKWLLILYLWAREYAVSDAAEEAEIFSKVVIDIYQWLHEVCIAKLLQTQIILGGPGVVVQTDEYDHSCISYLVNSPQYGKGLFESYFPMNMN